MSTEKCLSLDFDGVHFAHARVRSACLTEEVDCGALLSAISIVVC